MSRSSERHSGTACVNKGLRNFSCHPYVHPKWNKPAFTPGPQIVTSLRLVFISRPTEGRRLSWPGWLGEILRWFIRPKTIAHRRGGGESKSRPLSRKSDAITRRLYRKHRTSQFTFQHRSLVTNWEIGKVKKNSLELMQGPHYCLRLYLVQFIQLSFI